MNKNDDLTQIQRDPKEGDLSSLTSTQGGQDTDMGQKQALEAQNSLKSQVLELFQDSEVQEAMFQWLLNLFKSRDTTLLTQVEKAEQEAKRQYEQAQAQIQEQQTTLARLEKDLLALQKTEQENQDKLAQAQRELEQSKAELA
ncbi:hypothetical protein [Helicobacter felis]|uniref:hypothetical protein n=1 Tax=Helicobacter felis TaxID=214 RepID=UPI001F2B464D|nr:hypothetical protein [Helicobacter felis]